MRGADDEDDAEDDDEDGSEVDDEDDDDDDPSIELEQIEQHEDENTGKIRESYENGNVGLRKSS